MCWKIRSRWVEKEDSWNGGMHRCWWDVIRNNFMALEGVGCEGALLAFFGCRHFLSDGCWFVKLQVTVNSSFNPTVFNEWIFYIVTIHHSKCVCIISSIPRYLRLCWRQFEIVLTLWMFNFIPTTCLKMKMRKSLLLLSNSMHQNLSYFVLLIFCQERKNPFPVQNNNILKNRQTAKCIFA